MSLLPRYSRLSTWLDRWTRRWSRYDADRIRSRFTEFFSRWRSHEGNWFKEIARVYFSLVREDPELGPPEWNPAFQGSIQRLHFANYSIWHLETEVRNEDRPSKAVVKLRRGLEAINEKRRDQMERVDSRVAENYANLISDESLPVHNESPARMMDRLSVMSLKLYHEQRNQGRKQAHQIHRRRNALGRTMDRLRDRLEQGLLRFKAYRNNRSYEHLDADSVLKG